MSFFSKKLGFQQFDTCYRNDLVTSIVIVRRPFGALQVVPWGFSHSIKWEKTDKNLLSPEEILFLKSLVLDFFRSEELIIQWLAQYFSNYLQDPFKVVPSHFSCSILREKIGHIIFSTGEFALFSKICVFNNLLGPKKFSHKIQSNCQNTFWTL